MRMHNEQHNLHISFNPHAHEGRDVMEAYGSLQVYIVSIRTPMKGAIL